MPASAARTRFANWLPKTTTFAGELKVLELIAAIESQTRSEDSMAFADPEFHWPVIVEQMRVGLL